jgi:hypothetical protein
MAYSMTPQASQHISLSFVGLGPEKLYIRLTAVIVLPALALFIGLLVTTRAWICTIRQRRWVNRLEFDSWWLIKAMNSGMYRAGYANATEEDFMHACQGFSVVYKDTWPDCDVGHLALCPVTTFDESQPGQSICTEQQRVYA